MNDKKIRICVFIHYSISDSLPYYVQIYVNELSRHFDKVKILTNNSKLQKQNNLFFENVDVKHFENKGYDFGMFYRYILNKDLSRYSQIAIINDSNILLKKLDPVFDWAQAEVFDFWGIIDSHEKPWFSTHQYNYHIQSHFLVLNQKAIDNLPGFLKLMDVQVILDETNIKQLRRLVIDQWEIGLSRYFISEGLKSGSYINSNDLIIKYQQKKQNLTHSLFHEMVEEGYPLLKKKVAVGEKKFFKRKNTKWKTTIDLFGNKDWDLKKLMNSVK